MVGRLSRAAGALALASLVACGSQAGEKPSATAATVPATSASSARGAGPSAAALPDHVDDLASAVPADAPLAVLVPSLDGVAMPKAQLDMAIGLLAQEMAAKVGLPESVLKSAVASFDGAAFFSLSDFSSKSPPALALVVRFKDAQAGEDLFKALKFQLGADGRYTIEGDRTVELAWLPKARVAIVGARGTDAVQAALDSLTGKRPAFTASPALVGTKKPSSGQLFAFADLHRLIPGEDAVVADGSKLTASITMESSEISLVDVGARVPHLGDVLAPVSHDALGKLPGSPGVAAELSLARMPGKTIADVLAEIGRAENTPRITSDADAQLGQLAHLSLADIDRALGEALTVGVYVPDTGAPAGGDPTAAFERATIVGALSLRDAKVARSIFDAVKKLVGKGDAVFTADKVVVTSPRDKRAFVVQLTSDAALFAFGEKSDADKRLADLAAGKSPFAKTPAFAAYAEKAPKSQLSIFIDPDLMKRMVPKEQQGAFTMKTMATDLVLSPFDQGLKLSLVGSSAGTAAITGTVASLAIYGVRRYLTTSKTAEAKNMVGAISRDAQAAFEREQLGGPATHKLCPTAKPTSEIPHGKKVAPDAKLFETDPGWSCLKLSIDNPVYYQYEYRQGPPYKCTKRGMPDPGASGFEVSAEGDLDGNGKTSLFCVSGKVVNGSVQVSPQLFTSDENE